MQEVVGHRDGPGKPGNRLSDTVESSEQGRVVDDGDDLGLEVTAAGGAGSRVDAGGAVEPEKHKGP